jgi:hypothetical protein
MTEFKELENGRDFLKEAYDDFCKLPLNELKKKLGDSLYFINHFIDCNKEDKKDG